MKRIITRLTVSALLLMLVLAMTGCKKQKTEIDAQNILFGLLNQVAFDTELEQVGNNAVLYFPELPETTVIQLYTGSGYFADEVALLTLPNAKECRDAMDVVKEHVKEMREQFMFYVPEELNKIDHAVICQSGRYIFLCITNDYANAERVLNGEKVLASPITETHCEYEPDSQSEMIEGDQIDSENNLVVHENDQMTAEAKQTSPEMDVEKEIHSECPVLRSQSGTYHDYGTFAIRVDNTAFEQYSYSDSAAGEYAAIVNRVADALDGKTTVYDFAIPTAIGIVLPDDIAGIMSGYSDQGEAIRKIYAKMSDHVVTVNCFDNLMQHRDEYLYFRTDYHWNGRGAYYAYESFCVTKGIKAIPLDERVEKQFDGFLGELYWNNCSEDPVLAGSPDTVLAYCPKSTSASMSYTNKNGETCEWNIITDVSDWKASTKYSTFAGADNPIATFTNPDITDNSVCVIVKESFGNALLPFLVDHYSTIYEIDYRYWQGDLIEFALEKGADDLLFANNLSMIRSNLLIGKLAGIVK